MEQAKRPIAEKLQPEHAKDLVLQSNVYGVAKYR
jgi:hypothetical protein